MLNLKFNSLINLKLTQGSGQTSQAPWRHNSVGNMDEFNELIYLKVPSIINELNDETINLNNLPILLMNFLIYMSFLKNGKIINFLKFLMKKTYPIMKSKPLKMKSKRN